MTKKEQPLTTIGKIYVNLFDYITRLWIYNSSGQGMSTKPILKASISSDLYTSIENKEKELTQEAELLNEKIKKFNQELKSLKIITSGTNGNYVTTNVKVPKASYYYSENPTKYINFVKNLRDADLLDKIDDLKIINYNVCVKKELVGVDAKKIQNLRQQRQTLVEERRALARKNTVAKTTFKNKINKEIQFKIDKAKIAEASKLLKKHGYKVMEKK